MRGSLNDDRRFFTILNHGSLPGSNRVSYPQYNARKEIEIEEPINSHLIKRFESLEQHPNNTCNSEIKGGLFNKFIQKLKVIKDVFRPSQICESVIEDNQTQLDIKAPFLEGINLKNLLTSHGSTSKTGTNDQLQLFSTSQQQANDLRHENNRTIQVNINLWSSPILANGEVKLPPDSRTFESKSQSEDVKLTINKHHSNLQQEGNSSCIGFSKKQSNTQLKNADSAKSRGVYFMLTLYHQIHDNKLSKVYNDSKSSFSLNKAAWLSNMVKQHVRKPQAIKPRYHEDKYLSLFQFKPTENGFRYELNPQNWPKKRKTRQHETSINSSQLYNNSQELRGVFAKNVAILEREEALCHGTKKNRFDDHKDHKNEKRLQLEILPGKQKKSFKLSPVKIIQKLFIAKQESNLKSQEIEADAFRNQRDIVSESQSDMRSTDSQEAYPKSSLHNNGSPNHILSTHLEKKQEDKGPTFTNPKVCVDAAIKTSSTRSTILTKSLSTREPLTPLSRNISHDLKTNSSSSHKNILQLPATNLSSSVEELKNQDTKSIPIFDNSINENVEVTNLANELTQVNQPQIDDSDSKKSQQSLFLNMNTNEDSNEASYSKTNQSTAKKSPLFGDLSNNQTTRAQDAHSKQVSIASFQKDDLNIGQISVDKDSNSIQPNLNTPQQISITNPSPNELINTSLVGSLNFAQELSSNPFYAVNSSLAITNNPFISLPQIVPNTIEDMSNQMSLESLMKFESINNSKFDPNANMNTLSSMNLNIQDQKSLPDPPLGGLFLDIGVTNNISRAPTNNSNNLFEINQVTNSNGIGPMTLDKSLMPNINETNSNIPAWTNFQSTNHNFLEYNSQHNFHNGVLNNNPIDNLNNRNNNLFSSNSMINNPVSMLNYHSSQGMQNEFSTGVMDNLNTGNRHPFNTSSNGINNLFSNDDMLNKGFQDFNSSSGSFISNNNNSMSQNYNNMISQTPSLPNNLFNNAASQNNNELNGTRNDLFANINSNNNNNGVRSSNLFNNNSDQTNFNQNGFDQSNSLNSVQNQSQNQNIMTQNLFATGINPTSNNNNVCNDRNFANTNSTFTPTTTDQANVFMSGTTNNNRVYRNLKGVKGSNGPRLNNII